MPHQLSKMQLESSISDLEFMQKYLGDKLFKTVSHLFDLNSMPEEIRLVYRKTAEFMANVIPEADHVVRHDVATHRGFFVENGVGAHLAVYFGVQSPAYGIRSQYIGLAYRPGNPNCWAFFISGAVNQDNLRNLINQTPATRELHGTSFSTANDFESIKPKLEAVANSYQREIAQRKNGIYGFIPATAYELQQRINEINAQGGQEARLTKAKEDAYSFYKSYVQNLSDEQQSNLDKYFKSNEGRILWTNFVQLIFSGYATDEALEIILDDTIFKKNK